MFLTDLLTRSTLLQHMIGGRGQCIAYSPFLHIHVPGPGNSGDGDAKFIVFRNLLSLNMIIHVSDLADPEPYTKG